MKVKLLGTILLKCWHWESFPKWSYLHVLEDNVLYPKALALCRQMWTTLTCTWYLTSRQSNAFSHVATSLHRRPVVFCPHCSLWVTFKGCILQSALLFWSWRLDHGLLRLQVESWASPVTKFPSTRALCLNLSNFKVVWTSTLRIPSQHDEKKHCIRGQNGEIALCCHLPQLGCCLLSLFFVHVE